MATKILCWALCLNIFASVLCRKHHLSLNDEKRRDIEITNFGLLQGGMLSINLTNLSFAVPDPTLLKTTLIGFTLDMSGSYESASYAEDHTNGNCVLKPGSVGKNDSVATVYLTFNFTTESLEVNRWGTKLRNLKIVPMSGRNDECMEVPLPPAPQNPPGDVGEPPAPPDLQGNDGDPNAPQNPAGNDAEPDAPQNPLSDAEQPLSPQDPHDQGGKNPPSDGNPPGLILKRRRRQDSDKDPGDQKDQGQMENKDGVKGQEEQWKMDGTGGEKQGGDDGSKAEDGVVHTPTPTKPPSHLIRIPAKMERKKDMLYINTSFAVCIRNKSEQGLYSFFYHHCSSVYKEPVNFSVSIVEKNVGPNYLSAGDIPLPTLYATMSLLFLCSAIYWIYYLCHQEIVFKIHYFMFFLALLKSLSLMFHAVDYHFIAHDGSPMQAFEILFYITYLTKGALLFGTIVLIGSGWAFIKPILSDQDKKLFWIVIPLQILANVAYIITDTSEEGEAQYSTWKVMFVTVDIICCGAILYPVVWSIRHLQDAAQTDGKAAISLVKLKLFRSYYVLVVCYIYFSRIVVYILKVTMPFQFMWLDEFFFELATYVFYVVTAYKFRPGTDNPYLQLPSDDEDDDEIEMDEVLTETGLSEGMKRNVGNATSRVKQRELNHSA